jgi:RNA polymerase sigma-70 factor (ECF subfamily)
MDDAAHEPEVERLLVQARQGRRECLGKLLERYRNYLQLLARTQIDLHLQGRVDTSDVVQEAFLDACRDFGQFRGRSEGELRGWLRQIVLCNLARLIRQQMGTQKRDVRREVSLEQQLAALNTSSARFEAALAGRASSPSAQAQRQERAARVADRLARLPPDYREVLVLRNLEGLGFTEVAERMGRSTGAVRILWVRALDQFRHLLEGEDL